MTLSLNQNPFVSLLVLFCIFHEIGAGTGGGGGGGVGPDATTPAPTPLQPLPTADPTSLSAPSPSLPAPTPSSFPTDCQTVNGTFGNVAGDQLVVSWKYSVELTDDVSESEFTSVLLPELEIAMNNALIPTLFDVDCRRRHLTTRRLQGNIAGISARPNDSMEPDVPCTGSNCFGVLGMLTLFLDTKTARRTLQESSSHIEMVRTAIEEKMDAGMFNDATGPILNVTWVNDDDESGLEGGGGDDSGGGDTSDKSSPSSVNGPVIGWVVGVSGVFLLAVAAAVNERRRRAIRAQSDFEALDGNSSVAS
jgi:hypothetical protein